MTNTTQNKLKISLSPEAHKIAKKSASQQANKDKVKQIYLNTLAVYAVNDFVNWLHFETDLEAGDSWNPIVRRFENVADLIVSDIGILECRPILPNQTSIILPKETPENRIAYLGIQFQEQLNEVELLGYLPADKLGKNQTEISLTDLEPIETLIDYLSNLERQIESIKNNEVIYHNLIESLPNYSLTEIVLNLQNSCSTIKKFKRRAVGGKILAEMSLGDALNSESILNPVNSVTNDLQTWQNLAQDLLTLLQPIWDEEL